MLGGLSGCRWRREGLSGNTRSGLESCGLASSAPRVGHVAEGIIDRRFEIKGFLEACRIQGHTRNHDRH